MSQMEFVEAIKSGNRASVEELIESGAELNQQDKQGWTPLNWAAGSGQLEIVELLLERGADPLAVGRDLRTPQMIALAAGHAEVVKRLRAAEAQGGAAESSDRKYCTAYHLGHCAATRRGQSISSAPETEAKRPRAIRAVNLRNSLTVTSFFCIRITRLRSRSGPVKT